MDWIKVDAHLSRKPEVVAMARILKKPKAHIVGLLVEFWSWLDANSSNGVVTLLSVDDIDDVVLTQGFGVALMHVKWLLYDELTQTCTVPNFERHNGKSAKKRALNAERQSEFRIKNGIEPRNSFVTPKATPEKIREDIKPSVQNPDGFERFWKAYPRRVAKGYAVKVWARLKPTDSLQNRMLECLRDTQWDHDPKKIPHPATWLNGKRWLDEVTPTTRELVL